MIKMFCDRCGVEIPSTTNGGVRVRTGNRELSLHLCSEHQKIMRKVVDDFCGHSPPRDVKQPTLSNREP